jgi:pimeloyl-ACP methyl ester carboxylesterase
VRDALGCDFLKWCEDDSEAVNMEDPSTVQAYDISLSGQSVHFWKGGTGPGLLLIHAAWGDTELSWCRVWDRLSRSRTVIAPDLPGFGRSSPLSNPSLPAMAKRLKELLDALRLDHVVVVGNSFGAAVAIQFANNFPKAVSHLVLVNGGYMPLIPGPVRKLLTLPIADQGLRWLIRRLTFSLPTLKRSFADPSKLPTGFFDTIQGNALAYSKISFDTVMNSTAPLAKPSVPTSLVWGAQDGLAPLKQARALQRWLPDSTLITINGSGHMPQVERPEEFVAAILGMTKQVT